MFHVKQFIDIVGQGENLMGKFKGEKCPKCKSIMDYDERSRTWYCLECGHDEGEKYNKKHKNKRIPKEKYYEG